MIEAAETELATATWTSSTGFESRKNECLRFDVEYSGLVAVLKRDKYTAARMDECIDPMGKAQASLPFDARSQ